MNFWIKLTQKGYFRTKNNENYNQILYIQINLDSKFQLQQTILNFGINLKKNTSSQKQKKMNITIKLKLTNAIFWTKFAKKGSYFQSKADRIDTTVKFCIFELVFVSNLTLSKQF